MTYTSIIKDHLLQSADVKKDMAENNLADIEKIAVAAANVYKNGGKLLFCGNGGSAADSQHIATELVVRLSSDLNRRALPALALNTNTSTLTAAANDYGLDSIFERQVEAFGQKGDMLIAISTSGNSSNIIAAVNMAKEKGMTSVGFLGGTGGMMKDLTDMNIIVPHKFTARIQEGHITVGHILCDIIEKELF